MKKFPLYFVLLFFAGCCANKNATPDSNLKSWEITKKVYQKLVDRKNDRCNIFRHCPSNDPLHIKNYNFPIRDEIQKIYPPIAYRLDSEIVRYKHLSVHNYGKLRAICGKSKRVKGYQTYIYFIEPINSPKSIASAIAFYDFVTICPPPNNSDCN